MGVMASQITSLTIVYSTVYSDADQRKHQSPALLAFAGNSPLTGEFSTQRDSNAENVSIWWRHHARGKFYPLLISILTDVMKNTSRYTVGTLVVRYMHEDTPYRTLIRWVIWLSPKQSRGWRHNVDQPILRVYPTAVLDERETENDANYRRFSNNAKYGNAIYLLPTIYQSHILQCTIL